MFVLQVQDGLWPAVGGDQVAMAGEMEQGAGAAAEGGVQGVWGGGQAQAGDVLAAFEQGAFDAAHFGQDVQAVGVAGVAVCIYQGVGAQGEQVQGGGGGVEGGVAFDQAQQAVAMNKEGSGREDGAFPGDGVGGVGGGDVQVEQAVGVGVEPGEQGGAAQGLEELWAVFVGLGQTGGAAGQVGGGGGGQDGFAQAGLQVGVLGGQAQGDGHGSSLVRLLRRELV